jgi:hypothetical protein
MVCPVSGGVPLLKSGGVPLLTARGVPPLAIDQRPSVPSARVRNLRRRQSGPLVTAFVHSTSAMLPIEPLAVSVSVYHLVD